MYVGQQQPQPQLHQPRATGAWDDADGLVAKGLFFLIIGAIPAALVGTVAAVAAKPGKRTRWGLTGAAGTYVALAGAAAADIW